MKIITTVRQIAVKINLSRYRSGTEQKWIKSYRANRYVIFDNKSTNNMYSKKFKILDQLIL